MATTSDYGPRETELGLTLINEIPDKRNRNEQQQDKFDMKLNKKGKQKMEGLNRATWRRLKIQKIPADTRCTGMNVKVWNTRNKDQVPQEKP